MDLVSCKGYFIVGIARKKSGHSRSWSYLIEFYGQLTLCQKFDYGEIVFTNKDKVVPKDKDSNPVYISK